MKEQQLFITPCFIGRFVGAIFRKTERQYLSGRGCDDMVQWDFMCTGW